MNNRVSKKTRINEQITANKIRLIDMNGLQVGIVSSLEAFKMAVESGLDLVEIAPLGEPPVCKIMDFGKYIFDQRKKLKKKSRKIQIKELKLRPVTDIGDYMVKIRQATTFLKNGDKVKIIVRFRGREMTYQKQGFDILHRIENDLKEIGIVEQLPKMEGKQATMLIVPGKK